MSGNRLLLRIGGPGSRFGVLSALAALPLLAAACGQTAQASTVVPLTRPALHEATNSTIGITDTTQGYTFDSAISTLAPNQDYQFRILGPDGTAQKTFLYDNTKLLHL